MAKVNGEPWVFYLGGANAVHCKYQSHHIRHPTGCGWVRLAIADTSIHPAASGVGEIRREVVREVKGLGCRRDFKR